MITTKFYMSLERRMEKKLRITGAAINNEFKAGIDSENQTNK